MEKIEKRTFNQNSRDCFSVDSAFLTIKAGIGRMGGWVGRLKARLRGSHVCWIGGRGE